MAGDPQEALEDLSYGRRIVFLLRDIEELSTQETAEILRLNVSAVKARLHRSRLHLPATLGPILSCGSGPQSCDNLCGIGRQL